MSMLHQGQEPVIVDALPKVFDAQYDGTNEPRLSTCCCCEL